MGIGTRDGKSGRGGILLRHFGLQKRFPWKAKAARSGVRQQNCGTLIARKKMMS